MTGLLGEARPEAGLTSNLGPGVGLSSRDCSTLVLKLLLVFSDLLRNFLRAKFPLVMCSCEWEGLSGGVKTLLGLLTSSLDSKL